MEMFFFLQKLSFSPLRTVLQDFILDLCTEQLSWHEFQLKLTERFPEYGAHFEKYRIASRPLRPPVPAQRLIYGDPNFPKQLTLMRDPPWTLTVSGSIQGFNRKTLSVVGSREPTEESIWWMETELQSLVDQGWVLASGGARGVDQKAHLLCLRKNRPCLANDRYHNHFIEECI